MGSSSSSQARYVIRYRGRVQGVGFRATTQFIAREFAVDGWVRNESDGSVLMDVQGKKSDLDQLHRRLMQEMQSHIDDHHLDQRPETDHQPGFRIAY